MFKRLPKVPPQMSFSVPSATSWLALMGGAMPPATITDCSASGLSIRYTSGCLGRATWPMAPGGILAPGFQAANRFSSFGTRSASVVSPTTTRTELFGRTHVVYSFSRSSRRSLPTVSARPVPE
jgi:hypothetical protein